jgi:hypothetical protein
MAVDPITNMLWYYCPMGRFLHIPPLMPESDWDPSAIKTNTSAEFHDPVI